MHIAIKVSIIIALLLTASVATVAFVAPEKLGLTDDNPAPTQQPIYTQPPATAAPEQMSVKIFASGYNSLDLTTTYTDSTNFDVTYYHMVNGQPVPLGSSASGSCTVQLQTADNNFVYAAISPKSGQSLYVDAPKTEANNPSIANGETRFWDISGTGVKHFVFKIDVSGTPTDNSNIHQLYIYPYFIPYAAVVLNSPADISGVGTSTATNYIGWKGSFTAAKTGFALTKVEFTVNTTDITKIDLDNLNIPNIGYKTRAELSFDKATSSMTWTWEVSPYDLSQADYIYRATNTLNEQPLTAQVTTTLASGDVLTCTLNLYGLTAANGPIAVITDSVDVSEA